MKVCLRAYEKFSYKQKDKIERQMKNSMHLVVLWRHFFLYWSADAGKMELCIVIVRINRWAASDLTNHRSIGSKIACCVLQHCYPRVSGSEL